MIDPQLPFEGATDRTPLVVDVDGTLICSDLLYESALQLIATQPWNAWKLGTWLASGKAQLKQNLVETTDPHIATIPLREETVAYIAAAKAEGRPVWLASASDKSWVEQIAARIDGIDGVMGSDGVTNLAGPNKAKALVERFGHKGFDYIGDHHVDMPVWDAARRAILVAQSSALERAVKRRFADAEVIARPRTPIKPYFKAMRPYQWAKNALVFLPAIAGHSIGEFSVLLAAFMAFWAFSFAASSAYIINDLLDLPGDRDHHRKRNRPFAAAQIPIPRGIAMAAGLMTLAIVIAALLPLEFLGILVGYVVITLAYSFYLKRQMLVDVIILGGLYTIRVLGGIAATGEEKSQWLLMFCLFFFLSLAIVKRCSELVARRDAGKSSPPGRGYAINDLAMLLPLGAAAGYASVMVVMLYLSSPQITALYAHPLRMWLICPLLIYWISRTLMLANRNEMHDDPIIFAMTDKISWLTGVVAALIIAVSI
ncbi:4-hydroxybenzoate polyprenyltransferase [Blastomonas natatoria]|uniref:4-hydroxybenzoate polyprenyltransferase n=1 Tax=Blastomonas natatoria TaxID=34015 RepID=A0A2V3V3E2_9SPHN|nr:UbiA family prenyltransferase [Blastomonas natatoria]PXW76302.1 4-hydroxybenzoate polyprenyltransferase [Blastomonas natatoria]